MKRSVNLAVLLVAMLVCALASAQSLGDAARATKSENKPASKKVYTNDDITTAAPVVQASDKATTSDAAAPASKDGKAPETKATDAKAAKADDKEKIADKDNDKSADKSDAWKKKVQDQKKAIADNERELSLMEREHQVRVSVYYADAGNQLRDSKKWFEDEKKYEEEHAGKQKSLADARAKLDEIKDEARKAGIPAGQLD